MRVARPSARLSDGLSPEFSGVGLDEAPAADDDADWYCPTCRAAVPLARGASGAPAAAARAAGGTAAATRRAPARSALESAPTAAGAPANRRRTPQRERPPLERTADGGVIVRRFTRPPVDTERPPRVPANAELLIVRYPTGTARVWRVPEARTGDLPVM